MCDSFTGSRKKSLGTRQPCFDVECKLGNTETPHFLGKSQPTGMKTVKPFIIVCRTVTYAVPQHLNCINKDTAEGHYSTSVWASKLRQQNQRSSLGGSGWISVSKWLKVAVSWFVCLTLFICRYIRRRSMETRPWPAAPPVPEHHIWKKGAPTNPTTSCPPPNPY